MNEIYINQNYVLDPHGAVGFLGLKKYQLENSGITGIFLETAHPAKFQHVVERALGIDIKLPAQLQQFINRKKTSIRIGKEVDSFKEWLLGTN
jgi:threonine synthase